MKARKRIAPRVIKPVTTEETQQTSNPRPYHIYALAEKVDQGYGEEAIMLVRYVGMTNDPKGRYQQHLAGDENVRKTFWIQNAQKYSKSPIHMLILDTTLDIEEAKQLEAFWILYHILSGSPLTNTQAGSALSLANLDEAHSKRLRKMLHDEYGCCECTGCVYDMKPKYAKTGS